MALSAEIINVLGDPVQDRQDALVAAIRAGHYQHIIVATGAGISTNAGIPDYRSSTGLFASIVGQYGLSNPEDVFSRRSNVDLSPIFEQFTNAEPTPAHIFCKWLHTQGWLRRVYTQNIDGLHQKAGLPEEMVVEFHGSIKESNVTLYGDTIQTSVIEQTVEDFELNPIPVDLIIVMGTSLQVAPFCAIPNLVLPTCPRVLVDLCPSNAFRNSFVKRKPTYDCMYDCSAPAPRSTCTFRKGRRKRVVSLRPQWVGRSKWTTQYIIAMDCDAWVQSILPAPIS